MNDSELEILVARARDGSRDALEAILGHLRHDIYGLALRMLADPADAEDASQEIAIKIITKLDGFRGDSKLSTWVYRIACNHLINRKTRQRRPEVGFDELASVLDAALVAAAHRPAVDDALLIEEARLFCTHGMLLCLDREHRLAYILGEILELAGKEASAILEISPAAFRKRLERARADMEAYLASHCGLVTDSVPCRCHKLAGVATDQGLIEPDRLRLARHPTRAVREASQAITRLRTAAEVFRGHPDYAAPESFTTRMRTVLHQRSSLHS